MSYSILSSNIVFGLDNVPQYSFVTPSDGILQLERLDGNSAVMQVDGRLLADTLQLSDPIRNRVVGTDAFGRLSETTIQVEAFQLHPSRLSNLESNATILEGRVSNLNVRHVIHNTGSGPALSIRQDGENETTFLAQSDGNTVMGIYRGGRTVFAPGESTQMNGVDSSPFPGTTVGIIGNIQSTGYFLGNAIASILETTDIVVSNSITTGTLSASGNMTALNGFFSGDLFIAASDARLKHDVREIHDALDIVKDIKGYTFHWNEGIDGLSLSGPDIGLIAQEVKATPVGDLLVAPAPFDYKSGGGSRSGEHYMTVRYDKLHALEIQSINELRRRVEALELERK